MSPQTYTKAALPEIAANVLTKYVFSSASTPVVLALHGDLGAGKTTFVQELARQLGVKETVTSPTFTIMKSYETAHERFSTLVHIDTYRFESLEEARPLLLEEVLVTPQTLVCIEWAERIAPLLPKTTQHLFFAVVGEDQRSLKVEVPSGF